MKKSILNVITVSFPVLFLLLSVTSCIDTDDVQTQTTGKTIDNLKVADDFSWETSQSVVLLLNAIAEHTELNSKVSVFDGNPFTSGALLMNCGVTEDSYFEGELQVAASLEKLYFLCEFPGGKMIVDSVLIGDNSTIEYSFVEKAIATQKVATAAPNCSEGCDEEVTSTSRSITVEGGKTYCITNSFEGDVTFRGDGGILRICGSATLKNLNKNGNAALTIQVASSGILNTSNLNLNGDARLENWGIFNYAGNFSLSGIFENNGSANISGLNINSGAKITNNGQLNISGDFNNNAEAINNGTFIVSGHFNNNGRSTFLNNCKIVTTGNFFQNSDFDNYGYLSVGGLFTINGGSETDLYDQAMIVTQNFMLNDNINGVGTYSSISIAQSTTINGSGSITGNLDICDANGIERNNGSIASTITYFENYIPISACNPIGIGQKPIVDADGDGVTDDQDEFPDDATLAYRSYFPNQNSPSTLMFEDLWPAKGDYDFNDLVAALQGVYYTNADNKVVKMSLTIDVKAVGASNRNGLGLQFDALNPNQVGSISGTVLKATRSEIVLNANGTEADQEKAVAILIEDVEDVISRAGSQTFNTMDDGKVGTSEDVEVLISFENNPVSMEDVSVAKLNFFLIKNQNRGTEIHLADRKPSSLMTRTFGTLADTSSPNDGRYFKTQNNLPWGILIFDEIAYPLEKTSVVSAYSVFYDWAASNGASNADWYQYPNLLEVWQKAE